MHGRSAARRSSSSFEPSSAAIAELRKRIRGEHGREKAADLDVGVPLSAPPPLQRTESAQLAQVFRRLDIDQDGKISDTDLQHALHSHGLLGVSKKDAREMLWEVAWGAEPALTLPAFKGAYARIKADTKGLEPRRLYNYIVYSLMDIDADGYVRHDEVYNHFFTYGDERGRRWLLEATGFEHNKEERLLPGSQFVRTLQSGVMDPVALQGLPKGKSRRRPASAPGVERRPRDSGWKCPVLPVPRSPAPQRYFEATAELRAALQAGGASRKKLAEYNSSDLRRERQQLIL